MVVTSLLCRMSTCPIVLSKGEECSIVWNAKVVKNRAAYCGVSWRVFERCGVYLNVEMNVQVNVQMYVQMNVQMNVQLSDQMNVH